MKIFKQQSWNEQLDVVIGDNGIVSVDGIDVSSVRENALANIVLRLNASVIEWKRRTEELLEELLEKEKMPFDKG